MMHPPHVLAASRQLRYGQRLRHSSRRGVLPIATRLEEAQEDSMSTAVSTEEETSAAPEQPMMHEVRTCG